VPFLFVTHFKKIAPDISSYQIKALQKYSNSYFCVRILVYLCKEEMPFQKDVNTKL